VYIHQTTFNSFTLSLTHSRGLYKRRWRKFYRNCDECFRHRDIRIPVEYFECDGSPKQCDIYRQTNAFLNS